MPPKKKDTVKLNKMAVKNIDEKQTPSVPVTYETKDILSSIALLSSPENELIIRSLFTLSKYSDLKEQNTIFLNENKIVAPLLQLIKQNSSDLAIIRFTLKLLGQVVTVVSDAAAELSAKRDAIKDILTLFLSATDNFVQEFCTQILVKTAKKSPSLASHLLKSAIMGTIFTCLSTQKDLDMHKYLLDLIYTILTGAGAEAKDIIPKAPDFQIKTIVCFLQSVCEDIQVLVLDILQLLSNWKNDTIDAAFRQEQLLPRLLNLLVENAHEQFNTRLFSILQNVIESPANAHDILQNEAFLQFAEWAKTCKYASILPTATIFTTLSGYRSLQQILFDFTIEDTILSFLRAADDKHIFLQTCVAISHMTSHRYCCRKILTPMVLKSLLHTLQKSNVEVIPYHEIAIATIVEFIKRDNRTMQMLAQCKGVAVLTHAFLKGPKPYTEGGFSNLLEILYMLTSNAELRKGFVDRRIYTVLLEMFQADASVMESLCRKSLLIMKQYVDEAECRQYFLELNGPQLILNKLTQTDDEDLFKSVLVFLERTFLYKTTGLAFLHAKALQTFQRLSADVRVKLPQIQRIETMMYDFYLPLKFDQCHHLRVSDRLRNRFYLVRGPCHHLTAFPFVDVMEAMQMSCRAIIYIVDFTANRSEMLLRPMRQSLTSTLKRAPSLRKKLQKMRAPKRSIGTASLRASTTSKGRQSTTSSTTSTTTTSSISAFYLSERIVPAINFGAVSSDPYLVEYVKELRKKLFRSEKGPMCFHHQVKIVAKFVHGKLSGQFAMDRTQCLDLHLAALREKLGYNVIPIGYLRCGDYCERALLFKALADSVGLPATLDKHANSLRYWNQVPLLTASPYARSNRKLTLLTYCVVDLMNNIGDLMISDSFEANKYCGYLSANEMTRKETKSVNV